MIADSKKHKGYSITNICDRIATVVYADHLGGVSPSRIVWLEYHAGGKFGKSSLDIIEFKISLDSYGNPVYENPGWKRLFEAKKIVPIDFLRKFGYALQELVSPIMVMAIEDKRGHIWRVLAGESGLFIITPNPSANIPESALDVEGVEKILKKHEKHFKRDANIEDSFTNNLIKGFLNKGL
jgi:hypothetical protein